MIAECKPKRIRRRTRYDIRETPPRHVEPLTPEQAELANDSFLLARIGQVASKQAKRMRWIDRNCLFSALCEAMVESARTFEPGRGVKFRTYAMNRVHFAVKDYLREVGQMGLGGASHVVRKDRGERRFGFSSLNVAIWPDSNSVTFEGLLVARDDSEPEFERSREEALAWLSCLSARDRRIIVGYVLDGMTMRQIGEEIGLSEARVCMLYKELIERLKDPVRRRLDATA